jgi:hypothetical protein
MKKHKNMLTQPYLVYLCLQNDVNNIDQDIKTL